MTNHPISDDENSSAPSGRDPDENTNAQCQCSRCVGIVFHEPTKEFMARDCCIFGGFNAILGSINRLAIIVLNHVCRLVRQTLSGSLGIVGHSAGTLFDHCSHFAHRAPKLVGHGGSPLESHVLQPTALNKVPGINPYDDNPRSLSRWK